MDKMKMRALGLDPGAADRLVRLRRQGDALELMCGLLAIAMVGFVALSIASWAIWWGMQ